MKLRDLLKENKNFKSYDGLNCSISDEDLPSNEKEIVLLPNKVYTLLIDYPLDNVFKKIFKSGSQGTTLGDLIDYIREKYYEIYDNPKEYGIYGHDITDLAIEDIIVDGDKITLSVGS